MIRTLAALALLMTAAAACTPSDPVSPADFSQALSRLMLHEDAGGILGLVDLRYQDDIGGQGRLGDDLRQLFMVYGPLRLRFEDLVETENTASGKATIKGKGIEYSGPWSISLLPGPQGPLIGSGILPELRQILNTLRERRLALETGVVERLSDVVSHAYQDRHGGREELISRYRKELLASYGMAVIQRSLDIQAQPDSARVRAKLTLIRHTSADKESEEQREETLSLVREGSSYRLAGGLD